MLVSILTPLYNGEAYVAKALENALHQTYQDIEIVVSDNASTDRSVQIVREYIEKYPGKIKLVQTDVTDTPGGNRTRAILAATGDYFLFNDCDDIIARDSVEKLAGKAVQEGYPDIVIDSFKQEDEEGNCLYVRRFRDPDEGLMQAFAPWAKLYKRSFMVEHDLLYPNEWFEDVLLPARVAVNKPRVVVTDFCGYTYVKHRRTSVSVAKLNRFYEGSLTAGLRYLHETYEKLREPADRELMMYCVMQYVAWYLLKLGAGSGGRNTAGEYVKAKQELDRWFPAYKKLDYVSFRKPKSARKIVRNTVYCMLLMMKLHIAKPFFYLYGSVDLSGLWPNL